jgi:hypothetical protein
MAASPKLLNGTTSIRNTTRPPLDAPQKHRAAGLLFLETCIPMDLEHFFRQPSGSFSGAFNSRHFKQGLSEEVRELAHQGLKLFPVGLAAKLNGHSDDSIAHATDDISLLEELSAAAQPIWGYRVAIGPSGLCVLVLDCRTLASLVPDLDDCLTLHARRGDVEYAFFRRPAGMKVMGSAKLESGVRILGDGESCVVPPSGGAVWVNPGAEIETLPYALRELLASDPPDNPPGRAMPAPKPSSPRPVPCRSTVYFPQPDKAPRRGHPACGRADWRSGYRISRRR